MSGMSDCPIIIIKSSIAQSVKPERITGLLSECRTLFFSQCPTKTSEFLQLVSDMENISRDNPANNSKRTILNLGNRMMIQFNILTFSTC